ncbi:MAG: Uncharacterised protein [Opitutia bacterium UBA7350]|nr:MAG: Uncharacterised protein [Opitutae bacterium UBA7350]
MYRLFILILLAAVALLPAQTPTAGSVIERARQALGSESALVDMVTLRIEGQVKPNDSKLMPARIVLTARKPCSQRLEIYVDDMLETTILHGGQAIMIRSHTKEKSMGNMRKLSEKERKCMEQSTRNLFNFYNPDYGKGELATYEGIARHRGEICDVITYTSPADIKTLRYFSRKEARLVATIREVSGEQIEIVEEGELFVDGVRFPQAQLYFQGRQALHRLEVTKVTINEALEDGIFDIPELKK